MDAVSLFDVVRVVGGDLPAGLHVGDEGTVVDLLALAVIEVEFIDHDGRAYAIEPLRAEQLIVTHSVAAPASE
jgi:hypothetical protein